MRMPWHTFMDPPVVAHVVACTSQEIGTRNGDGMACFARVAASAAAYEISPKYCTHLRELSARLAADHGANFTIHCADYRRHSGLDADVITWWAEEPVLKNLNVLRALKGQMKLGRLRASAQAVMIFDPRWPPDLRDYRMLLEGTHAAKPSWTEDVQVEEGALCRASSDARLRKRRSLCNRASGVFHVVGLPIASVRD